MNISLAKIRSFILIAEQGSFRKASDDLRLSQPALSMHVRDLETALGVQLLRRTTRSVALTPQGASFLAGAKRALGTLDAVVSELRDQASGHHRPVVIGCVSTVAAHILPSVLADFAAAYPEIEVKVFDGSAAALYRRIREGEADLGIGPVPPAESREIEFRPLLRDHFVAVFPRRHRLASRAEVTLDEILRYPLLVKAAGSNVRTVLDDAFAARGQPVRPAYEVHQHYTLGGMIEAGLGITLLPSMAVSMLGGRPLKTARIVDPEITRELGILRLAGHPASPSVEAFLWTLRRKFESLPVAALQAAKSGARRPA